MKNVINRPLFKEKTQLDSYSIKQVFDAEKQDLANFHAKAKLILFFKAKISLRKVVNTGSYIL
ncbi:hypothetical protein [Moraxella boevrei]|uniref:hypothetical protein n=1 Tax=Faucicola boevrei TaxID=346665 RepID=UPI003735ED07